MAELKSFWTDYRYVALDIETTGLDAQSCEIIEIAATLFEEGKVSSSFSCLIKTKERIPVFIKQLTGITDQDLQQKGIPSDQALRKMIKFIGDYTLVIHNSPFDLSFLQEKLSLNDLPLITNPVIDTLQLSRIYLPFLNNHKLETVYEGLFPEQLSDRQSSSTPSSTASVSKKFHRALQDAEAAGHVFCKLTALVLDYIPVDLNILIHDIIEAADSFQHIQYSSAYHDKYKKFTINGTNNSNAEKDYLKQLINYQNRYGLLKRKRQLKPLHETEYGESLGFNKSYNYIVSDNKHPPSPSLVQSSGVPKQSLGTRGEGEHPPSPSLMQSSRCSTTHQSSRCSASGRVDDNNKQADNNRSFIDKAFNLNGFINKYHNQYCYRQGQVEMAQAVRKAFFDEQYLVIEAGTGIGKTYAYLVAALEYACKDAADSGVVPKDSRNGEASNNQDTVFKLDTRDEGSCDKGNSKVYISTNTKNLQEQIFFKDLPALKNSIPLPFQAAMVKGRDNYLCLRKWKDLIKNYGRLLGVRELKSLLYLPVWQHYTNTGDISENYSFPKDTGYNETGRYISLWKKISTDRFFCSGKHCSQYLKCYYQKIKNKAEKSHLIVINHYLLLLELYSGKLKKEGLNLVVDEAHNLPDVASQCLGISLSFYDFQYIFSHLYNVRRGMQSGLLPGLKADIQKSRAPEKKKILLFSEIETFISKIESQKTDFEEFFRDIGEIVHHKGSYGKLRITPSPFGRDNANAAQTLSPANYKKAPAATFPSGAKNLFAQIVSNLEEFVAICGDYKKRLTYLYKTLNQMENDSVPKHEANIDKLDGALQTLDEMILSLQAVSQPDWDNYTLWLSSLDSSRRSAKFAVSTEQPNGIVNYSPINISEIMFDLLYDEARSIVFTSATLSLRGSCRYYLLRLGLDKVSEKEVAESIIQSPFDYEKQTRVIVPKFLPSHTDKYFQVQAIELLKRIITVSQVGVMVLFTSYRDLNAVYDALKDYLYQKNVLLLAQGKGHGRTVLLNEFKRHGKAVLLGTSSFWEGVDIPGASLSLLVLYKLPFQVPTEPVIAAYYDKLKKENKDPFLHATLPTAMLKFRQGFGRLIRNDSDKGIVLILDSRIITKKYGSYFRQIIPRSLQDVNTLIQLEDIVGGWFNR